MSVSRTTISLATVIMDMAEECMQRKGFCNNFSAYLADLIRRDAEHQGAETSARWFNGTPDADTTVLIYSPQCSDPVWPGYWNGEQWRWLDTDEPVSTPVVLWAHFPHP